MTFATILKLGRVSNLPTVWTNALAGAVLAGGTPGVEGLLAALALSLFYTGGMWLNDAFDAEIDAAERANRPIPMGEIGRGTVFAVGWALLGGGVIVAALAAPATLLAALGLALFVVLYDWLHKRTVLGPVLMGMTRFLSYLVGALAVGTVTTEVLIGGLGLFAWVVGLTYAAKQEAYDRLDRVWPLGLLALPLLYGLGLAFGPFAAVLPLWFSLVAVTAFAIHRLLRRNPGDVPRAVVTLIAGIALYDAVLIAATGATVLAVVAVIGFLATLALQRLVSGT